MKRCQASAMVLLALGALGPSAIRAQAVVQAHHCNQPDQHDEESDNHSSCTSDGVNEYCNTRTTMPTGADFVSETGYGFDFDAGDYIWGEATCAGNVHVKCSLPVGNSNNFSSRAVIRGYVECRVGSTVQRVSCPRNRLEIAPEGISSSKAEEAAPLEVECEEGLCFSEDFEEFCAQKVIREGSEEWSELLNPAQLATHCTSCCLGWAEPCLLSCRGGRDCISVCMERFTGCLSSCS
jgi:hypothetical protein